MSIPVWLCRTDPNPARWLVRPENRDCSHLLPHHGGQGNNMRRLDSICTPKDQCALHLPAGKEGSEEVQCMVKTPIIIKQIWPPHVLMETKQQMGMQTTSAQEKWGSPLYNGGLVEGLNFYLHQHCPQPSVDRGVSMKASLQRKFKKDWVSWHYMKMLVANPLQTEECQWKQA